MSDSVSNENAKRILSLLEQGDEKIKTPYRDVVLVLGNTGSGKSTFTHYVAGNNDNLISVRVGQNSGEYIISDTNNKISVNTTVISKTTFPDVVVDDDTKNVFVDCPGFNDSRNEAYDIAAAYFIKKVFNSVRNVKIVLVASYPSLRKGVNRNDFLQLLEHTTILIKNIEKYVDGIALVATKVDNAFDFENEVPVLIRDGTIIENIAQFLLEVKDSLKIMQQGDQIYTSEFKRTEDKVFFEHANTLLDSLLQKNGTDYTKLGIFRRPNKPGKLTSIPILQNGKKSLKKIIEHNLQYLPVDKSDIGYTVSEKSKNVIRDLVTEIHKSIGADMAYLKSNLIQYFGEFEQHMYENDMYALLNYLKTASSALSRITGIGESASIDEMINTICENFTLINARVSKSRLRDITNLNKFMTFLQEISVKKFDPFAWKLVEALDEAVKYVDNSIKWYSFLASLHQRLSDYDVQKNIGGYKIPKLLSNGENFQIGDSGDFSNFFQRISNVNFLKNVNFEELKKVYVDSTKIRYFGRLINATLNGSLSFTCTDNSKRLQVSGEYVKLSQIKNNACFSTSRSIQIFAKHTIFIDTDLGLDNKSYDDITIIALKWHVIDERKIQLDGADGEPHSLRKARSGSCYGCDGLDGLPGKPGQSAGHFYGIGDVFINPENLVISSVGGAGGIGQHGGNGVNGEDGKTFRPSNVWYLECNENQVCTTRIDYSKSGLFSLNVQAKMENVFYGTPGKQGGNAGRGGIGGIGGKRGTVNLIGSNKVRTRIESGDRGSFGLHGDCGAGGRGGQNIHQYYYFGTWSNSQDYQSTDGRAQDGYNGRCLYASSSDLANAEGRKQPEEKPVLYSPPHSVSDYKKQLVQNFANSITKHESLKFYTNLQSNPVLKNVYDARIILGELQEIEKHNEYTPDTTSMLYQSLLVKTIETAKTFESDNLPEDRKLLEILYVIFTSKLMRLKSRPDNSAPLHRREYAELLTSGTTDDIRRYYKNLIEQKITGTMAFVESLIIDDLNNAIERLDDEIIAQLAKEDSDELDSTLLQRKLLSDLKSLSEFLSLSGSLARADADINDPTQITGVLPSLRFDVMEIPNESYVVSGIIQHMGNFEDKINRKCDAIISIISKQRKTLQSLADNFDDSCNQLYSIEKTLLSKKHTNGKSFSVENVIDTAIRDFNDVNFGLLENTSNENLTNIVHRSQNHLKIVQFDAEMYHQIRHDSNTETLVAALHRTSNSTVQLEISENKLFKMAAKILKIVNSSITTTGYKPNDVSEIRLLVQDALESLKVISHEMTDQFEVDEDLQLFSENIDEAINALVNAYDNLYNHEDRARLDAFLRYVENSLVAVNNDLRKTLRTLIRGDVMLYEYERLVDVFKRYAFPFETLSTSALSTPPMPRLDQDVNELKSSIDTNVWSLQSQLDTLQQSNEYVVEDYFNATSDAGAFFVWKNQIYGNAISKLLRGKEIALKASVNENHNYQMIKFDSIYLSFRSSDDTIQGLLDEALDNFHISMTHSGNSYFEFCNRVHLLNSNSKTLTYARNDTDPAVQMEPVLSPYTTWILKLHQNDANVSFNTLEPFRREPIDLQLEGHAQYLTPQNKSICDKFESSGTVNDYTSLMNNNTQNHIDQDDSSKTSRKRRDVSTDSFKDNTSFLKSLNPFSYLLDTNFQNDHPSPKSLDWSTRSSSTGGLPQLSFNFNSTLALWDYVVRNVTKVKPYQTRSTMNLDQVRAQALDIVDKFESMSLNIPSVQLDLDPVELMSQLEKAIVNADRVAITKVLQDSATFDSKFRHRFDTELVQMLDQIFEPSIQPSKRDEVKDDEQLYTDYVQHAFIDYENANGMIASTNENYNASLLDW